MAQANGVVYPATLRADLSVASAALAEVHLRCTFFRFVDQTATAATAGEGAASRTGRLDNGIFVACAVFTSWWCALRWVVLPLGLALVAA